MMHLMGNVKGEYLVTSFYVIAEYSPINPTRFQADSEYSCAYGYEVVTHEGFTVLVLNKWE
jgi:hypothetical protein